MLTKENSTFEEREHLAFTEHQKFEKMYQFVDNQYRELNQQFEEIVEMSAFEEIPLTDFDTKKTFIELQILERAREHLLKRKREKFNHYACFNSCWTHEM